MSGVEEMRVVERPDGVQRGPTQRHADHREQEVKWIRFLRRMQQHENRAEAERDSAEGDEHDQNDALVLRLGALAHNGRAHATRHTHHRDQVTSEEGIACQRDTQRQVQHSGHRPDEDADAGRCVEPDVALKVSFDPNRHRLSSAP